LGKEHNYIRGSAAHLLLLWLTNKQRWKTNTSRRSPLNTSQNQTESETDQKWKLQHSNNTRKNTYKECNLQRRKNL